MEELTQPPPATAAPVPAKSAKPAGNKKKQIDFIVTTSNPSDASSARANKKRVRSVAALKSWPERRKKMFEELEGKGVGLGAFLVERGDSGELLEEGVEVVADGGSTATRRPWAERRTRAFRQDVQVESSNVYFEGQSGELRPPIPPSSSIQNTVSIPRVPPGFTDASPRYIPFGPLPDRTTPPPRDYPIWSNNVNNNNNYTTSSSNSDLSFLYQPQHQLLQRHLPTPRNAPKETYEFPLWVPWSSNPFHNHQQHHQHNQPSRSSAKNKKRTADGIDKDSLHGTTSMALLTPPTSPQVDAARGRLDPFSCYTVEWQPWFDRILHHSKLFPPISLPFNP